MSVDEHEQRFGESRRLPKLAERRQEQRSDTAISTRNPSLEAAIRDNLALEDYLQSTTVGEPLEQSLTRLLSTRTVVSTSSSFAKRQQAAVGTTTAFREIGTGSIGKVFEHPGTIWAYKLPLTSDETKLWNNYTITRRIENSFEMLGPLAGQVETPRAFWYAQESTNEFWDASIDRFPFTDVFPLWRRDVLCLERIFPLPKPTRDCLVDLYCHEAGRESAKANAANGDCLVRPLLGRPRQSSASRLKNFSLRNFKLHLDQIKDIGLEADDLAFAMADALAVLHWHTKIDAMDIEFVLGSSPQGDQIVRRRFPLEKLTSASIPTSTFEHVTNSSPNFGRRMTSLWLLDFDACKDIALDQTGVNMACKAFVETEPYCPRAHSSDIFGQNLWISFGNRYIATARKILDHSHQDLPVKFLDGVTLMLSRQSIPRSLVTPAFYQPIRESSTQQRGFRFSSRGQSLSSSYPTTDKAQSSAAGNASASARSSADYEILGKDRGRGDSGDAGTQRGSRGGSRGGRRGFGSRGKNDNRVGSNPFASGPWRG